MLNVQCNMLHMQYLYISHLYIYMHIYVYMYSWYLFLQISLFVLACDSWYICICFVSSFAFSVVVLKTLLATYVCGPWDHFSCTTLGMHINHMSKIVSGFFFICDFSVYFNCLFLISFNTPSLLKPCPFHPRASRTAPGLRCSCSL